MHTIQQVAGMRHSHTHANESIHSPVTYTQHCVTVVKEKNEVFAADVALN